MTYEETLDFLYSQLPIYQRIGKAAYKADLSNTIALCRLLGNPENGFKSIHVAGTNGKGSTSHILASILQEAGYSTGLYTSPHLADFRERIKINGKMIPKENVVDFVAHYGEEMSSIKPSFFEMTVGMAFDYFRNQKVDIAVIETGLGGRLDSTNVITPEVAVITNIGIDHTHLLGDSIEKIAAEKAGIIKPNVPVIIGRAAGVTKSIFEEKATEHKAPIHFAELEPLFPYPTDLKGSFQAENLKTAQQALKILTEKGWKIAEDHIEKGAASVLENTGLKGRWQTISENPLTICDIGHNEDGIRTVLEQISKTPHATLHIVLGLVNDKNIDNILAMLPKDAIYYFCKATIPRALEVELLQQQALQFDLKGNSYSSVIEALKTAQNKANSNDLVFVGGSTFVVAEIL